METARKNLKSNSKSEQEKKVKNSKIFKDVKNRDVFYVFNYENNEGFSIISADKRMVPILAQSDSNYFDFDSYKENPGLSYWLTTVEEHITFLRDSADNQTESDKGTNIAYGWIPSATSARTNDIEPCPPGGCGGGGSTESYGPLIDRQWGQGCGFNDYSPSKSNGPCGRAPAGCGPVAVAKVMWYYRNRLGRITYNGVPINFNNMPRVLTRYVTGEAPDLARLMRFIGDWIIIDWAADYAMAQPSKIPELFNFLGFSSELKDLTHSMVKANLRGGYPVIFKARTSGVFGISTNHHSLGL